MRWRKSQLESNHFKKPVYRSKRKKKYCESDDKHKEQQKDKNENVKKGHQGVLVAQRK